MRRIFTRDRIAARRRRFVAVIALVVASAAVTAFALFSFSHPLATARPRSSSMLVQKNAASIRRAPTWQWTAQRSRKTGSRRR